MQLVSYCRAGCNCYFCGMHGTQKHSIKALIAICGVSLCLLSCDWSLRENKGNEPLARVGDTYLYRKDVKSLIHQGMSKHDSATFMTNYINNWASKQLLLSKSRINLSEEQLADFERLVTNYRVDLYTTAYKDALLQQSEDTLISDQELEAFYEKEKENFKLKEVLLKLRFIELPQSFLNKEEVEKRLKNFASDDLKFLDSVAVHFKKLHFNDSIWVKASRVIEEIPPLTFENADRYLKKSQFFEIEDSLGVYLGKVTDLLEVNDIAPLPYIKPTIKQVLLNRRRLDYIRKLETEIIDEAIKEKEFEVYEEEN